MTVRPLLRSLPALAALLLAGCLELRESVVLTADGGGTLSARYVHDPAALASLVERVRALWPSLRREAEAGPPASAAPTPARPVDPAWFRAAAERIAGYVLSRADSAPAGGDRVATDVEARFTSLEDAARGGAFLGACVSLERLPKQRYRLTLRDPWTPSGPGAADAFGGIDPARVERDLAGHLGGLSRTLTITFPVAVEATNGLRSEDGRTVTWTARADDPAPRPLSVLFVLPEESAWSAFRHAPDLAALTRRCVRPPPPAPNPPRDPDDPR